jgi:hypothetical protein
MKQKTILNLLLVICFLTLFQSVKSQNLAAYVDYKNAFNVFHDGVKIQLDHRKAESYKVGYTFVAYINVQNELWVYQNDKQSKIIDWVNNYTITDNLMTFGDNGFLNVYENGNARLLCSQTGLYGIGDSIVAYHDIQNNSFEVYYNQKIIQLETDLLNGIESFKVGENLVAYINPQNYFLAFYHGEIIQLMYTDDPINFEVGLNTIAYINPAIESFHVVYYGEEKELEEYPPLSFKCGDNMVAYVTMEGEFYQYYKGNKVEVSSFAPDTYAVTDNMLVYEMLGRLYAFYKGQSYELANFLPNNYQIDRGSVAFTDQQGKLWLFNGGEKTKVSIERITSFELVGNTLHYDVGTNTHKVYYKGRTY